MLCNRDTFHSHTVQKTVEFPQVQFLELLSTRCCATTGACTWRSSRFSWDRVHPRFCVVEHLRGAHGGLPDPPGTGFSRVSAEHLGFLGLTRCEHAATSSSSLFGAYCAEKLWSFRRCSSWARLLSCPSWFNYRGYGADSAENCLEVWCSFWTRFLTCPLCNARCRSGSAVFCDS